jgi:hypothetical protein
VINTDFYGATFDDAVDALEKLTGTGSYDTASTI